MKTTQISDGKRDDCNPLLADLLWETDPELFHFIYDGDKSLMKMLFVAEWPLPVGFFSHRNMMVATQSGQPVGHLNCFAGKRMSEISETHVQWVPGVAPEKAPRLLRGLEALGWLFPVIPDDAFYVLNIVVSENARGEGLGARLMSLAEDKALSEGLKSVHLDSAANAKAITFYRHLGYEPLVETRLCQLRESEHVPSHYRMVKMLS